MHDPPTQLTRSLSRKVVRKSEKDFRSKSLEQCAPTVSRQGGPERTDTLRGNDRNALRLPGQTEELFIAWGVALADGREVLVLVAQKQDLAEVHTMYPLIRRGSIVQIDGNQRKVLPVHWENEHERPIFFIELRDEYICGWCEIREGHLLAVPYRNSRCEIRRFRYPREAEIVGRVAGVTMRLAESHA